MLISVAMATYNGASYLREQLDSLAAQTRRPAELVVGDDGSDDETPQILNAFSETAPFPVRLLGREERRGFADNFLRIAAACEHPIRTTSGCPKSSVRVRSASKRMAACWRSTALRPQMIR
jgi:glycosyltransferase involved in cell wall biosynthesis